jgi:hypothetical protein
VEKAIPERTTSPEEGEQGQKADGPANPVDDGDDSAAPLFDIEEGDVGKFLDDFGLHFRSPIGSNPGQSRDPGLGRVFQQRGREQDEEIRTEAGPADFPDARHLGRDGNALHVEIQRVSDPCADLSGEPFLQGGFGDLRSGIEPSPFHELFVRR